MTPSGSRKHFVTFAARSSQDAMNSSARRAIIFVSAKMKGAATPAMFGQYEQLANVLSTT